MTTTAPQISTDLPAPGGWTIDGSHSSVEFVVRHLMVSKVHGRFTKWDGILELDPENPANSRIEVTIDAASLRASAIACPMLAVVSIAIRMSAFGGAASRWSVWSESVTEPPATMATVDG